jgi:hypothetical protein
MVGRIYRNVGISERMFIWQYENAALKHFVQRANQPYARRLFKVPNTILCKQVQVLVCLPTGP